MEKAVIRIHLESQPEGGYTVTSPDVPALITEGETIAECLEIAQEVADLLYKSYVKHGDPMPEALQHWSEKVSSIDAALILAAE